MDLAVSDLDRALAIYRDATGFPEAARGDGWVEIDAVTARLRLVATAKPEHRASVRLQVNDVERAVALWVEAGAVLVHAPLRTPQLELLAALRDFDGHTLYPWRALTEDEYDFLPELPTEMTWQPEAEALLKSLLTHVPALFRALARRKVTLQAESLASETSYVGREEVIRGYILGSPKVTRGRNREPLIAHGIDVDKYQADWDAD